MSKLTSYLTISYFVSLSSSIYSCASRSCSSSSAVANRF